MCTFTTNDFSAEILRFVTAQAGAILPRPPIQTARATTFLPVRDAREPAGSTRPRDVPAAGGQPFEERP